VQRETGSISIERLRDEYLSIDFPEYQRESTVWDLEQKQRLIDSILREFDISAIFMYRNPSGSLDCIDGRQRINAILSFLGRNPADADNGFRAAISNEIIAEGPTRLQRAHGMTFTLLDQQATQDADFAYIRDALLRYQISMVTLSGAESPEEFNLQFLRLNLGALINAGEKLHAMVGEARDQVFGAFGNHPFLMRAEVPTRRYAKEQIAAQVWYQAYNMRTRGEFTRARHLDLQRFLKSQYVLDVTASSVLTELSGIMDVLESQGDAWAGLLRNRAMTVSVLLAAWSENIGTVREAQRYVSFLSAFSQALADKTDQVRTLDPSASADRTYLIDFQRHITQAAVERPAVEQRHSLLVRQLAYWRANGQIEP
jgi:hypothetical protein